MRIRGLGHNYHSRHVFDKPRGLGDVVAMATHVTGIDKVAKFTAKIAGAEDCGCSQRQEDLNKLVPFGKK